jgi:hypothetical protein
LTEFNPRTVNRANVLLSLKYSDDASGDNPFNDGSQEPHKGNRPDCRVVTRSMVADLGNPNSRLVGRLIVYPQQAIAAC